jgi:hypothetical protein
MSRIPLEAHMFYPGPSDNHYEAQPVASASEPNAGGKRPPPKAGLQFVNLTDTAVLDAQSRKLVRAHVMKDYDKRLTAERTTQTNIRTLTRDSSTSVSAKSKKKVYEGMHRWRPGPMSPNSVQNENRRPSIAASSTISAKSLQSESSSSGSPEEIPGINSVTIAREGKSPVDETEPKEFQGNQEILASMGLGDSVYPPGYRLSVGGGRVDPFNSLPIPSSYRTETLVTHCKAPSQPLSANTNILSMSAEISQ